MPIEFKEKFLEYYSTFTDIEKFKECCTKRLRRSFRVNTLKSNIKEIKSRLENWKLESVPWCKEGFFINSERRDIGNTIEHQLGYIYVQEASSMLPPLALELKPDELVLDMCASPGSKTTQIAAMMENKGLIIANDYKYDRLNPLSVNLQRCGVTNTIINLMEGRFFKNFEFDKILVDAPCSGTGIISKSLKTLEIWNPKVIQKIVGQQKQLLKTALDNLKVGGKLVYSTCSIEPIENEGVINHILETYKNIKLKKIDLNIKSSSPILEYQDQKYDQEIKKCLRVWPQDNNTSGFFVSKIEKI